MLILLWGIARNTFTEAIRQPVYLVILVGTILLLALNPALSAYTFDDDNKLLFDLGLSTLFLSGMLLAAFTAAGVFSREIENHTVLTVISKPVGRPLFVLGKYLGVSAALAVAYWIWILIFLLTVRHKVMQMAVDPWDLPVLIFGLSALFLSVAGAVWCNYFYGWVFSTSLTTFLAPSLTLAYVLVLTLNKDWQLQDFTTDLDGQLLWALLLVAEALLIICAIALAASTRLQQGPTLAICAVVFLLGLSAWNLFGQSSHWLAGILYTLVPSLEIFWQADSLTQGHLVPPEHVLWLSGYAALYVMAILSLAVAFFQTREVG